MSSQRQCWRRPRPYAFPKLSLLAALLAVAACKDDPDPGPPDGATVDAPVDVGAEVAGEVAGPDVPTTNYTVTILHTGDLHSHLMGHGPEADYTPDTLNDDTTVGGYARLATAIGTHKAMAMAAGGEVLLVDSGDFMMGTLFELGGNTGAIELKLMQAVGYDAVALGNHEYDWTTRGLAAILKAAYNSEPKVTFPLLATNLQWSAESPEDNDLEMFKDPGPIRRKFIKTLPSGLKVGFFGLLGMSAVSFAPSARPLTFATNAAAATEIVAELRNVDKVDLVVALSHSGVDGQGRGEDAALPLVVSGIDVIVSGHSHDKLMMPLKVRDTHIVAAGAYGEFLGRLDLTVSKTASGVTGVAVKDYQLLRIDDKIAGNTATQTQIDNAISLLDANLSAANLSYKKVLAETAFDLRQELYKEFGLGNLIADAYRASTAALQPTDPPVIAVEANGSIRADLLKGKTGNVWFADLFRVTPLGIGPNMVPGYPLVTYYLHGKDLDAGLEIAAAAKAPLADDAYFMQVSGLEADIDTSLPLFSRVNAVRLKKADGTTEVIDVTNTTKCYKVVTTIYLAGLFGLVKSLSRDVLSVDAKEADCTTKVASLASRIVDANPAMDGVQELKQWQALAGFISRLPDTDMPADMIPNIPAAYQMPQGRIKLTPP